MKKSISLILSLIILLSASVLPYASVSASDDDWIEIGKNLYFWFDGDTGTLTFKGKGDKWDEYNFYDGNPSPFYMRDEIKHIVFKKGITGVPVWYFTECSKLTSVSIPNTVKYIGREAFSGCISLKSLYLPDSVKEIGSGAFYGCTKLEKVRFSKNLKVICRYAFMDCKELKSVKLPKSLKSIYHDAFNGCKSLTSVKLPKNINRIAIGTFSRCVNLKKVFLPKKLIDIESESFYKCKKLKHIYFKGSKKQWKRITNNEKSRLKKVKIHFNYKK